MNFNGNESNEDIRNKLDKELPSIYEGLFRKYGWRVDMKNKFVFAKEYHFKKLNNDECKEFEKQLEIDEELKIIYNEIVRESENVKENNEWQISSDSKRILLSKFRNMIKPPVKALDKFGSLKTVAFMCL